jgi:hypothetical protein
MLPSGEALPEVGDRHGVVSKQIRGKIPKSSGLSWFQKITSLGHM